MTNGESICDLAVCHHAINLLGTDGHTRVTGDEQLVPCDENPHVYARTIHKLY
jgi:hypothetical protein